VVDDSASITSSNFDEMKSFLLKIVGRMDIASGNTRIGLVTVSTNVGPQFDLNAQTSVSLVQAAISTLNYSAGATVDTAAAFAHVRTSMLTSAAGDRSYAPNVVVLLTVRKSINTTATRVGAMLTFFFIIFIYSSIQINQYVIQTPLGGVNPFTLDNTPLSDPKPDSL